MAMLEKFRDKLLLEMQEQSQSRIATPAQQNKPAEETVLAPIKVDVNKATQPKA